jgi:hypothetical protein
MVSPTILALLLVFTSPDFSVVSCAAVSPAVAVILTAVVSFLGYLLMSLLVVVPTFAVSRCLLVLSSLLFYRPCCCLLPDMFWRHSINYQNQEKNY